MKHLSPTLAILALATSVSAIDISGDGLKVSVKGQLQTQAILGAKADNTAGNDFDQFRGNAGESEAMRFNVRRARVAFEAKYGDGWKGAITLRGNENKLGFEKDKAGATNQGAEIYYAYAGKSFKTDDIEHEIVIGLDKVFNSESSLSSSAYALPFERPTASLIETRTTGLAYRIGNEFIHAGVNLANNSAPVDANTNDSTATKGDKNGMWYGFRIEFAPGKEYMPKKRQESYLGTEGTHVLVGFDYGNDNNAISKDVPAKKTSKSYLGPDVIVHWNALTGLIEYKMLNTKSETVGGASAPDVKGTALALRLAWAVPLDNGHVVEPALGYAIVDTDTDNDNQGPAPASIADGTNKSSGTTLDLGVNYYFSGNNNKLQLGYRSWTGEEPKTGDKAKSNGIVLQHQLLF